MWSTAPGGVGGCRVAAGRSNEARSRYAFAAPMASSTRAALPFRTDRPSADVRLFCLPFAGGSAATYRTWGSQLPSRIDVCPVELPGRGTRFAEPPMRDFAALVDHLAEALEPLFDRPVAFFEIGRASCRERV